MVANSMLEYPEDLPPILPSQPEQLPARRWPGRLVLFFRELIETALVAGLLFLGINAISARIQVESISMQPTLYERDMVLVNRLAYFLARSWPERCCGFYAADLKMASLI
jgi:hypothetical protein